MIGGSGDKGEHRGEGLFETGSDFIRRDGRQPFLDFRNLTLGENSSHQFHFGKLRAEPAAEVTCMSISQRRDGGDARLLGPDVLRQGSKDGAEVEQLMLNTPQDGLEARKIRYGCSALLNASTAA